MHLYTTDGWLQIQTVKVASQKWPEEDLSTSSPLNTALEAPRSSYPSLPCGFQTGKGKLNRQGSLNPNIQPEVCAKDSRLTVADAAK